MSTYTTNAIRFYDKLSDLSLDQAEWSQKTFGSDQSRGPVGALRHLSKEAQEAADDPTNIVEYADCLLLLMDAIRRAGWKFENVIDAATEKMKINKERDWPQPTDDQPVEHIKNLKSTG